MTRITTVGLDLAKKVFQIHGVDGEGQVVVAWRLRCQAAAVPAERGRGRRLVLRRGEHRGLLQVVPAVPAIEWNHR
jgi:hypothetical protein